MKKIALIVAVILFLFMFLTVSMEAPLTSTRSSCCVPLVK